MERSGLKVVVEELVRRRQPVAAEAVEEELRRPEVVGAEQPRLQFLSPHICMLCGLESVRWQSEVGSRCCAETKIRLTVLCFVGFADLDNFIDLLFPESSADDDEVFLFFKRIA